MSSHAAGDELKLLVREAHARGIEVILDVVFNHTAEGNEQVRFISVTGLNDQSFWGIEVVPDVFLN